MREFNAKLGRLELTLEWRLTLFTVLLLPFLVTLGFWQLDRAGEKRILAERHLARQALPALDLEALEAALGDQDASNSSLADRQIAFTGSFINDHYILLDNRLREGRFGYELIALVDAGSKRLPVNLGWVQGDPARRSLPEITLPSTPQLISGRVYLPLGDAYLLADQAPLEALPAVIQAFEGSEMAAALSKMLQQEVLPLQVRIDQAHPLAQRADWPVVNQSPEKHTGYAVQWFTMAAVLFIAFVLRSSNILSLIRKRPSPGQD